MGSKERVVEIGERLLFKKILTTVEEGNFVNGTSKSPKTEEWLITRRRNWERQC